MLYHPLRESDLTKVDELYRRFHQDSFGLPSLEYTTMAGVIESKDKLIACGMIRLIPEAIMVLDLSQSPRVRLEAINLLLLNSEFGVIGRQMDGLHAFVQDTHFADLLKSRFGFSDVVGQALVRKVE